MRSYSIRFSNGRESGAAIVAQPDMVRAFQQAHALARRMMHAPECCDRAGEGDHEARIGRTFSVH
jgi:hypothetical protein